MNWGLGTRGFRGSGTVVRCPLSVVRMGSGVQRFRWLGPGGGTENGRVSALLSPHSYLLTPISSLLTPHPLRLLTPNS